MTTNKINLEAKVEGRFIVPRDSQVFSIIDKEVDKQRYSLEMIPSENHTSPQVRAAESCIMMDKYAEGYPGKRYYGGCKFHDEMEMLAIERVNKLFGSEHANVQPHSGSQANMAAYFAILRPGDTVMAMELNQGGHLTHGSPVNFSGQLYKFVPYTVDEHTERLDYDHIRDLAKSAKPKLIVAGYTAYSRDIDFKAFRDICDEVGAKLMVDMAHIAGLVAGHAHQSPVPYANIVTSTTQKTLRGPRGGFILCKKDLANAVDKAVFPGIQGGPFIHTIAAKAVCFGEALDPSFTDYAHQIVSNSKALASSLTNEGLKLVSGGTDNHLLLVNLIGTGVGGKEAQIALDEAGISVNKNTIPYDVSPPFNPSGIRLGTPAVTTRGMKESEMKIIGSFYGRAIRNIKNPDELHNIRQEVHELCSRFSLP